MRRRLPLVLAAVLVAGTLIVAGAWMLADDERDPRAGSDLVEGAPPVAITRVPESYRIVYRLEDYSGDDVLLSTDRLVVHRPFESRLETREGAPPGGRLLSVQIAEFGRLQAGGRGRDALTSAVPPRIAPSDVRLEDVLPAALAEGLVKRRETRQIGQRRCQVYRTTTPLSAGALSPPTKDEYADSCVDSAGLVLEEVYVLNGRAVSRKIAVEVEEGVDFDPDAFDTADDLAPLEKGGGSVRSVEPSSRPPGRFFELGKRPAGFSLHGRYAVVRPQPEAFSDPTQRGRREASVVDVYVDGIDVLFVERGSTLGGFNPFPEPAADSAIPLANLGDGVAGEMLLAARGAEFRALIGGGSFVRVAGTVTPERLVEVAGALRAVEGGELVYLDEPAAS